MVELDHLCGVENLYPAQGELAYFEVSRSVYMARHPRGIFAVYPLLCLWKWPHQKKIHFTLSGVCKKFARRALLSRMLLALHATRRTPHCASRLVQAMPAWSVKARRAMPRHCGDPWACGHTVRDMCWLFGSYEFQSLFFFPRNLQVSICAQRGTPL